MSTRERSLEVFVLDVSQLMQGPPLENACRAVRVRLLGQMAAGKNVQAALVCFGTTSTHNPLHAEEEDLTGDIQRFADIYVTTPLEAPTAEDILKTLIGMRTERGQTDWPDTIAVAIDVIKRKVKAPGQDSLAKDNVRKRITIVSSFLSQGPEAVDDDYLQGIYGLLTSNGIMLDIVSLDEPAVDNHMEHSATKAANKAGLELMSKMGAKCRLMSVRHPVEILAAIQPKEYKGNAYFAGALHLTDKMHIKVKVCKMSGEEKMPAFSKVSPQASTDNAQPVERVTEVGRYQPGQKDKQGKPAFTPIPLEQRQRAYKLGGQYVPADDDEVTYTAEKDFSLMGFTSRASIERHALMKDTWIVVPEKNNELSLRACSALARALHAKDACGLVRFVPRAPFIVSMMAMMPCLSDETGPDFFKMNTLPFYEDVRKLELPSLQDSDLLPSREQEEVMARFVDATNISGQRAPERVPNPQINRTLDILAHLAAGQTPPGAADAKHAELDAAAAYVLGLDSLPADQGLQDEVAEALDLREPAAQKASAPAAQT